MKKEIQEPSSEELQLPKDAEDMFDDAQQAPRYDRYGHPIRLKKYVGRQRAKKSLHKVTFVDQIEDKIEIFKESPDVDVIKEGNKEIYTCKSRTILNKITKNSDD